LKAQGVFICTMLVIDTFFVSYACGFNSRHVMVVDPALPPIQIKPDTTATDHKAATPDKDKDKTDAASKTKTPTKKDAAKESHKHGHASSTSKSEADKSSEHKKHKSEKQTEKKAKHASDTVHGKNSNSASH
jgi:hypothetical protein